MGSSETGEGGADKPASSPVSRPARRLSDKVLSAFHSACDTRDLDAAAALLRTAEKIIKRTRFLSRRDQSRDEATLVASHERLWHLLHVVADPDETGH